MAHDSVMVFLVLNLDFLMIVLVLNLGSYHYVPVNAQCFSDYVPAVSTALSYNVLSLLLYVIPFMMSLRLYLPSVIIFLMLYPVPVTMSPDFCDEVPVFIVSFLLSCIYLIWSSTAPPGSTCVHLVPVMGSCFVMVFLVLIFSAVFPGPCDYVSGGLNLVL
jgi:hypothetical protein